MTRLGPWIAVPILLAALTYAACGNNGGSDRPQEPFRNPPEISSRNGTLETTLSVVTTDVDVGGTIVRTEVYNGLYVPPTLRARRGDRILLHLQNRTAETTNLHYHGMNVTPLGNGDNVFVHVVPETTFDYRIPISQRHPQGLYYYHPHQYGTTERQIMGGLSGLLIVEGLLDPFPELAGIPELQMALKDTQIVDGQLPDDIDPGGDTHHTLNGQTNPIINIRPGELQLWRIGNIGADQYYDVVLDGHQFFQIARDGNRTNQLIPLSELLIPPSSRFEVLVRGGSPGTYAFRSLDFNTGPVGDSYSGVTLATLIVGGDPVAPIPLPANFPPVADLRTASRRQRTVVFSETDDGNTFFIDGRMFDESRVDTTVAFGSVEEWTIKNCTQELHVFHIHQLDFQVTEVNGQPQPFTGHQDTENMPFASTTPSGDPDCPDVTPGIIKVIIPFTDPANIGKFVYHCHIGEHEDNGMMATIEVKG
jgi:FtsP/CotA-like multicopper oxidase with cupredoxin domain